MLRTVGGFLGVVGARASLRKSRIGARSLANTSGYITQHARVAVSKQETDERVALDLVRSIGGV